jgi:hypothetical protein
MKRNYCAADLPAFTVAERFDVNLPQPVAHYRCRYIGGKICAHSAARMIGVAVCDQRTRHRTPWVNIEISSRAEDARGCKGQRTHARKLAWKCRSARAFDEIPETLGIA